MSRFIRTPAVAAVALLLIVSSFLAGVVAAARYPDAMQPIARSTYSIVSSVWGGITSVGRGAPAVPPVDAMNANTLQVSGDQTLPGTVIFGIRGQAPGFQDRIVEVDRRGTVLWEYRLSPGLHAFGEVRTLPNHDVLYIETSGALPALSPDVPKWVVEVDRAKNIVRHDLVPATHHAEILPSGNLLLVDSGRDRVTEMNPHGDVVWTWDAHEQLRSYGPSNFVGMSEADAGSRSIQNAYADFREGGLLNPEWTHMNSAQRLSNGDTLISLRNFDLVIEVDRSGRTVWSFGPLIIKHQHCAWMLENGDLLISDNGNGRIIEVNRQQQIVWQYSQGLNFATQGCAYRLPSGNTLITDATNHRILEVSPSSQLVWELKVQTPGVIPLYRAWWVPPS